MKYLTALLPILLLASCSAPPTEGPPDATSLVIRGGTLIDGTGAEPRMNGTIVVRGNRIQSVSEDANQPAPEGARVINAEGKFVLPGLIDGHTHYAGYAGPLYLHNGITSVVDTGNVSPWIYTMRKAIEQGEVPGPRIYTAGSVIDNPPPVFLYGVIFTVETEEAARASVRDHVAKGADAIKIYKQLRPELLQAVIEEAHAQGVIVTGHIALSARDAVQMGMDSIEHASGISIATMTDPQKLKEIEENRYTDTHYMVSHSTLPESFYHMKPELYADLIQLFVERGTSITPTLVCYWLGGHRFSKQYEEEDRALLADPAYAFIPELDRRWIFMAYEKFGEYKMTPKYQQAYKNLQLFLKQFSEAGGKIVAGSDATPYEMHGINLHRELELLVDAGLTPMQALLGATRYAAEKFQKWDEVGSVEPGKYSDFVILDANPLEDIRNTQKIHMVIQNGRVVDTTLHGDFIDKYPPPQADEEAIPSMEKLLFGG